MDYTCFFAGAACGAIAWALKNYAERAIRYGIFNTYGLTALGYWWAGGDQYYAYRTPKGLWRALRATLEPLTMAATNYDPSL